MFKFNNGRGAIVCDRCSVIIDKGIPFDKYKVTPDICDKCRQKDYSRKVEEIRNEIIQRN